MKDVKKMRPLGDRVLVKQEEAREVTKGGIIVPDTVKKKPLHGVVISVGPGINGKPMVVKAGDRIQFGTYAGTTMELNEGEYYLIMREADIFLVDDNVPEPEPKQVEESVTE